MAQSGSVNASSSSTNFDSNLASLKEAFDRIQKEATQTKLATMDGQSVLDIAKAKIG
ncbi:hypothetical protein ACTJJ7_02900 [Phyllobacterium sp. 22229]|uniref:Uncharacterized protein n=1 Tax=Phyllobacterium myrsinacearum TaxID=28101 RepID=A0A839ESH6_9HYPH|nr:MULTISPECIES: hypothetical protein [Phyllobacterium]MBA8879560.1 hypothetical protein [Phyllobacterium myrsinacearum]MBA8901655.1 hypothetical protein [Phyllobacterium sp. P30BS-XVII]QND54412.1 hypothetical protein HB779_21055 [Phyllobacterium sp. 628]RZS77391.1 hypothetical protein EV217_4753 [Phyllobacterium myrsinacearum]UGX88915.1 hypothetical protein LLE53_020780 [Phyllobacterium sp. T1293]